MTSAYLVSIRLLNRNVRLFLASIALVGFTIDGGLYSVLFNLYLLRLGYGPEFIGVINSAGLLTFAGLGLPAGMVGSRWGSRRAMIAGVTFMFSGAALLVLAEFGPPAWQTGWLLTAFVLVYVGLALYFVNAVPFLMAITRTAAEQNRVFSLHMAIWSLAGFAGSMIGGILPGAFAGLLEVTLQHPGPYRFTLGLAAVLIVPTILILSATREPDDADPALPETPGVSALFQTGAAILGLVALMALVRALQVTSMAAGLTFFNIYLDTVLGASTVQIGLLVALARLLAVPAVLVAPLLAARQGNGQMVVWASLGSALGMLPLALTPHWLAAGLGFMSVVALTSVRYPAFAIYTMEQIPARWRATMSGAGEMAAGFSFAVVALSGGYMIAWQGYTSLFLAAGLLTGLGALLFWVYLRRR